MTENPPPVSTTAFSSGLEDRPHYPALDGLRGLAILFILAYHNFGFINFFHFGWLGVDLFFVLSGFLITDILLRTVGEKNFLKNFYVRRVLRIFPLYYACLLLFLVIVPSLFHPPELVYYADHQVWLWTYLQNWLFVLEDSNNVSTLHHLWSLSVEEQFYLVWPLVVLLLRKPRLLLLFIALLIIVVTGLRWWAWNQQFTGISYFNLYTFTRIDGLCIGCVIAIFRKIDRDLLDRHTIAIVLFFAGLNFAFFFINRNYSDGLPYLALTGYLTFAMLFGLLLNRAVRGDIRPLNTFLTIAPLKFLGKISYGLYIFHWPVHLALYGFIYPWIALHASDFFSQIITSLITVSAAITISWFSFRYFESYFLKMKGKFQ